MLGHYVSRLYSRGITYYNFDSADDARVEELRKSKSKSPLLTLPPHSTFVDIGDALRVIRQD